MSDLTVAMKLRNTSREAVSSSMATLPLTTEEIEPRRG
jgi:hypothetical protein